MTFRVDFAPVAERQLGRLDPSIRNRIVPRIRTLAGDPRPSGAKQLNAGQHLWRIRIGSYRIVYQIQSGRLIVLILRIGHRRDVYRRIGERL